MAQVSCTHCHLTFDESVMIKEEIDGKLCYFCCHGCQGVYHLLHSEGLDTFYAKLGNTKLTPPQPILEESLEKFDLEGFQKRYVKVRDDGLKEISLIIEGIHCSACVWLNEKVLRKSDGVIEADINYTTNKAKVVWDDDTIKLSKIIQTIRAIGYNAFAYDAQIQEELATKKRKEYYMRILVAVFGSMNIMWIAVAKYAGYFTVIEQQFKDILNVAEFILATPVLFYSGWVFFRGAYYGYKNRMVNMDILVATGATLTYIYSIYAMITRSGEVYFESVAMIITFVLVGKYLEVLGKKQAVDTLDQLKNTIPTEVLVVNPDGTKSLQAVENIKAGDILEVNAGEKIVIDGIITKGEANFDESSLTGESLPLFKTIDSEVLSGSICTDSTINYKATKDVSSSLLSSIVALLEDSITKKPRIEQLANSVSGYFSVIILAIAIATFVGWWFFDGSWEKALIISISVVVIACPCALGLATPMATLVGIGTAAKRGIIFKEASFLETMAKGTKIALDKTGTITQGKPTVVSANLKKSFNPSVLYPLVSSSTHPISIGIKNYLEEHFPNIEPRDFTQLKNIQGKGFSAIVDGSEVLGGNLKLLEEFGIDFEMESDNLIFICVVDGEIVASFELKDKLKDGAREAIEELKKQGLSVVMLTGDHQRSAKSIAQEAGIEEFYANLLPQDKAKYIDDFKAQGDVVIMAGDGINDSIALTKSNIAIAMGGGADVTIGVSDVVLLDESPKKLKESHLISKRTYRSIKENISFSIIYNIIAVPLAIMGFVNPLIAALSMSLSSLVVVSNSMRIKNIKFKDTK
ncbi:MAG TPA: cadmium-translocating P-type ATPase [Epsilonproteobacteria bacterium]|nr:cadmium-translocating P-type ATPase [Campylobacterota bacterium]